MKKKSQIEKFREAAREAEDAEKSFDEKLQKISRQKPQSQQTGTSRNKRLLRRSHSSPFLHEAIESITIWLDSVGSAPSDKFIRVDYDPNDEKSASFEAALAALGEFVPTLKAPGHVPLVAHDFENARVFLRLVPNHRNTGAATL
jgi:hypothetical protein